MKLHYAIGPSIGIARIGNSKSEFYLEPDGIGALPIECDQFGNPTREGGHYRPVRHFKDPELRVKRQAARFTVFQINGDDDPGTPIDRSDFARITWTVHLANKKSCWYEFNGLQGNRLYPDNDYAPAQRRHPWVREQDRQSLIIDPGPRELAEPNARAMLSMRPGAASLAAANGERIETLGEIRTDSTGSLIVLGGFGKTIEIEVQTPSGRQVARFDDTSDGSVTCKLEWKDGREPLVLEAWCIVAPPRFAPEIVNLVTLEDTMQDVAVRHFAACDEMYRNGEYRRDYIANFDRDIRPILERPAAYRWVAPTPTQDAFAALRFDRDEGTADAKALREAVFSVFRRPAPEGDSSPDAKAMLAPGRAAERFPMMPLNLGDDPNQLAAGIQASFLTLTETQYFLLGQWAQGKFTTAPPKPEPHHVRLTRASLGNCVGGPFCPGYEVTWTARDSRLYRGPLAIRHADRLRAPNDGLSPFIDETRDGQGCEPGDLTKRMTVPWQTDMLKCNYESIAFTSLADDPPAVFSAYWWPAQVPVTVFQGERRAGDSNQVARSVGETVPFMRDIESADIAELWYCLGFVANRVEGRFRSLLPSFVEQERGKAGPSPSAPTQ